MRNKKQTHHEPRIHICFTLTQGLANTLPSPAATPEQAKVARIKEVWHSPRKKRLSRTRCWSWRRGASSSKRGRDERGHGAVLPSFRRNSGSLDSLEVHGLKVTCIFHLIRTSLPNETELTPTDIRTAASNRESVDLPRRRDP